jgi:hypothetical protein
MRHDETRDNTTAIEATIIEADKRAREESAPYPPAYPFPVFGGEPDPAGVQLETDPVKVAELHDKIVAEARRESEERNGCDDEPEDDGQPSEYTEWQDYMGGDEYYDHSENECW